MCIVIKINADDTEQEIIRVHSKQEAEAEILKLKKTKPMGIYVWKN